MPRATVIKLTAAGLHRVLDGKEGMTFLLDTMCGIDDRCAAVRDYRYPTSHFPFQTWVLGPGDFEVVEYEGPSRSYANQLAGRLNAPPAPDLLKSAIAVLESSFARNYRLISPFKELAAAVAVERGEVRS